MNAQQLIESLQRLPPDTLIVCRNKDGFLDSLTVAESLNVRQMKHYPDYKRAEAVKGDDLFYAEAVIPAALLK